MPIDAVAVMVDQFVQFFLTASHEESFIIQWMLVDWFEHRNQPGYDILPTLEGLIEMAKRGEVPDLRKVKSLQAKQKRPARKAA